jgi:predicted RecB family nuclease
MLLTEALLESFLRCPRRVWLDQFGDPGDRQAPSAYLSKLRSDSALHRAKLLSNQTGVMTPYGHPNPDRAAATLALMAAGASRICDPLLRTVEGEASPDVLVRVPGTSRWGNWHYEPLSVKLGKRPKRDYQLLLTYQTWLLATLQGMWPLRATLLLRDRPAFHLDPQSRLPQLQDALTALRRLLQGQEEPEVFISRKVCSLCPWLDHCRTQARAVNHLSLLPGVSQKRYQDLQALGLGNLAALVQTDTTRLIDQAGLEVGTAQRLTAQARASWQATPLLLRPSPVPPASAVELYFDIEAEPDSQLNYLYGVLVVSQEETRFEALLTETLATEQTTWEQLLELFERYPQAPIFHFCNFETDVIRKLGQRYCTSPGRLQRVLKRMHDLHLHLTETTVLPVENYALKTIARWLGFDWRDAEADGAQSILWYSQWQETGDRRLLDRILAYNEDDCRATWHLKQWLAGFLQAQQPLPVQTTADQVWGAAGSK